MNDNMDDDVKNILAILQGTPEEKPQAKESPAPKKAKPAVKNTWDEASNPSVVIASKEQVKKVVVKTQAAFLENINEPEDKSIYNSKVLIREDVYEIFMSLKRVKKFKSVSTLIDFALEEYIKTHREDIKKTLYESKKNEIL